MTTNRRWLLASRPTGMVAEENFELTSGEMPEIGDGEVLLRTTHLSMEPAMRGWIDDRPNYLPPVGIGEVMRGMTLAEVVSSDDPAFAAGDVVTSMSGWQEYAVPPFGITKVPEGIDPLLSLSVLGMTGVTAYFGLLDIGRPEA